jgi:hypothetical protein
VHRSLHTGWMTQQADSLWEVHRRVFLLEAMCGDEVTNQDHFAPVLSYIRPLFDLSELDDARKLVLPCIRAQG